jgi:SAM-dependent methyltransferase
MNKIVLHHPVRVAKAMATNLAAAVAPGAYARWTEETGRGRTTVSSREVADYFIECVDDYSHRMAPDPQAWKALISGKIVLEYGPGDIPGVALILAAQGAARVICVDRFPLIRTSDFNREVLQCIVQSLSGEEQARARVALDGFLQSNGMSGAIRYAISPNGLFGVEGGADVILSRAVLEHVNRLDLTFQDMKRSLRLNGIALHLVDLKSHGMHISNSLDFLCWPEWLWRIMYGAKGAPNRIRASRYLELAKRNGFEVELFQRTGYASIEEWRELKDEFADDFSGLAYEDAACQGFWLGLRAV